MEIAFFIGLLSALHCFGMCGGIVGALTLSLEPARRTQRRTLVGYVSAYNIGRIASYTLAGGLAGALGQGVVQLLPDIGIHLFRSLFLIFIILLGLYIGGWFPRLARIEKLGQPVWNLLQPLGKRYLPVRKLHHAFLFGLVWGWLPCGLVYYALVMALARHNVLESAQFMFAFGMGTFIPMLLAGVLLGRFAALQRSVQLRKFNALVLIIFGIIGLLMQLQHSASHL